MPESQVLTVYDIFLGLSSVGAGAYYGYCSAKNILMQPDTESALVFGPAIVQGIFNAAAGGIAGTLIMGEKAQKLQASLEKRVEKIAFGALGGALVWGTIGAGIGGMQTLIGYCIGYSIGIIHQ